MRSHLDIEQSHDYLRQALCRKINQNAWSIGDLFEAADKEKKGFLSVGDFEWVLMQQADEKNGRGPSAISMGTLCDPEDLGYLMRLYSFSVDG